MSVARNTVNTEQTDQPLLNSQGGASEVSPTTFNEVLPELKHITMTYLLDTDEHTPTLPSNLLTKTSVDPDLLDISFSSRHARYQDPYKYTKTAFKLYVSCAETVMTRADDVNAPPQTACEAVTCKIITYSLGVLQNIKMISILKW